MMASRDDEAVPGEDTHRVNGRQCLEVRKQPKGDHHLGNNWPYRFGQKWTGSTIIVKLEKVGISSECAAARRCRQLRVFVRQRSVGCVAKPHRSVTCSWYRRPPPVS